MLDIMRSSNPLPPPSPQVVLGWLVWTFRMSSDPPPLPNFVHFNKKKFEHKKSISDTIMINHVDIHPGMGKPIFKSVWNSEKS